jgi:hypothetical protein
MLLFIPRSLCALKRVAAKAEHARYAATQGIRIALRRGLYRAEDRWPPGHRRAGPGADRGPAVARLQGPVVMPKDLERAAK